MIPYPHSPAVTNVFLSFYYQHVTPLEILNNCAVSFNFYIWRTNYSKHAK
jgi:hypothetical protein